MCSPDVPDPDPQIGQAALQNADIAQQQLDAAKAQLQWNKDQAAVYNPLIQNIVNQQIAQGDKNTARADEQWDYYKNLFQPVEERTVTDAIGFDSPERQATLAGQAASDVTKSYGSAQEQAARNMERMGVNPNSARFQAVTNENALSQAKDTAGAMNKARQDAITQGMALRTGVAQFGRNMPNTGLAADSAALNAGNSATGNMAANANINNANTAAAQNWFNSAAGSNTSSANIGLGLYNGQLNAYQAKSNNMNNTLSGLGGLAGLAGGFFLRKGGVIRNFKPHRPRMGPRKPGGLSYFGHARPKGYAEGGMIEGPGTGTSDSIPGTIEGQQPIRLSNGEAVLNKEAVELVGEEFIHRINAGGLAMLKRDGQEEETEQEGAY